MASSNAPPSTCSGHCGNHRLGRIFDRLEYLLKDAGGVYRIVATADILENPQVSAVKALRAPHDYQAANPLVVIGPCSASRSSSSIAKLIALTGGERSATRAAPPDWA